MLSADLKQLIEEGQATDPADYQAAMKAAEAGRPRVAELFARAKTDVLLTPAALGEAPEGLDSTGDPLFCRLWTMLGLPAVSVPGLTGSSGLPVGVQLVGPLGPMISCSRRPAGYMRGLRTATPSPERSSSAA
jgi:Asp-tRNA(Asn)/Glu-tRNA(Gln) amidotransferase A subunit family amidase